MEHTDRVACTGCSDFYADSRANSRDACGSTRRGLLPCDSARASAGLSGEAEARAFHTRAASFPRMTMTARLRARKMRFLEETKVGGKK
jgi:hypothetical protein